MSKGRKRLAGMRKIKLRMKKIRDERSAGKKKSKSGMKDQQK
jgi:hypothetical protein